jgi:hypothetical protein
VKGAKTKYIRSPHTVFTAGLLRLQKPFLEILPLPTMITQFFALLVENKLPKMALFAEAAAIRCLRNRPKIRFFAPPAEKKIP